MIAESIVVTAEPAEIAVAFGNDKVRLLMEVVPVAAPILTAVAAPAKFMVVAVVFSRLATVWVVVIVPPLALIVPEVVTFPVRVEVPSIVRVPLVWIFPALLIVTPVSP